MYTNILAVFFKTNVEGEITETEGGGKCLERHTYTMEVANLRKNWKIDCGY